MLEIGYWMSAVELGRKFLSTGDVASFATGIDTSPSMLNIAARNRMRQDLANISFQLADATNQPFPDGYFDYVSVSFGLHDKEKPIRDNGFEVVDKSEFSPTPIVRKAIVSGELDIYPDKSGHKTLRELIR